MKKYALIIGLMFLGCEKNKPDLPPENYDKFFPTKPPEKPLISYDDMNVLPCDPMENKKEFKYPGVKIKENIRVYTVMIKAVFNESHRLTTMPQVFSKLDIRYIDGQGKLKILKTYIDEGKKPILKKGKIFEETFKVKSGYPLYLAVYGAGFDYFNTSVIIKAKSDDGVITPPKLSYRASTHIDGYQELTPYCQKVILP